MNTAATTVVTLVHGTFARNASWTKPESNFSTRLSSALSGTTVINRFEWSGKNKFSDRMSASEQLADQIAKNSDEYPDARQIVVAHSHGGNIVASLPQSVFQKISLAVCLSTPFILLKKRDENLLLKFSYVSNFILGMVLSYITFVAFLHEDFGISNLFSASSNFGDILDGGYGQEFLAYAMIQSISLIILIKLIYGKSKKTVEFLDKMSNLSVSEKSHKLVIVRTVADEASFAISFSHFVSRVSSIVYDIPATYLNGIWEDYKYEMKQEKNKDIVQRNVFDEKYGCVLIIIYLAIAVYLTNWWFPHFLPEGFAENWLVSILVGVFVFGGAIIATTVIMLFLSIVLIALVFWPTWLLGAISGLALGRELSLCFPFFEATAEATPAGNFRIYQLSFDETDGTGARLRHSAAYDSEAVIRVIESLV